MCAAKRVEHAGDSRDAVCSAAALPQVLQPEHQRLQLQTHVSVSVSDGLFV